MNPPAPVIGTAGHEAPPRRGAQRLLRSAVNAWEHRRKRNVEFVPCWDGVERKPEQIRAIILVR